MKNIVFVFITLLFTMCKSPKVEYIEYTRTLSQGGIDRTLSSLDAQESIYSVLIFKLLFEGEIMKIENCDEIVYNDSLNTSRQGMISPKLFRINNNCTTKITDMDRNYSFKIKSKDASKYKYIYIRRTHLDNDKYVIIYSNTLRGFL